METTPLFDSSLYGRTLNSFSKDMDIMHNFRPRHLTTCSYPFCILGLSYRVWHAVCSKIQSSQIFIQSNHFGVMSFNLIFQTYSNNPKKHSIQTHVSQFNLIRVNIYSIQSRKYLFNPITKIFIQSNHGNIYSIQSRKYSFNQ